MDRLTRAARGLWSQLMEPSPRGETAASFLAFGLAHCALGAAAAQIMGPYAILFALAYGVVKEGRDVRVHHGSIGDSVLDTAFVALGGLAGPLFWIPVAAVLAVARDMVR